VLFGCCFTHYRTTKALSDKLFAQLDFDGSGGISFKEFLIGLEKMVMEEFDDEDGEVRF
jgi:Ca2+-binding EF-hand superfamily protein